MRIVLFCLVLSSITLNVFSQPLYQVVNDYANQTINEEPHANSDRIDQTLISVYTRTEPTVDGNFEPLWKKSKKLIVWDNIAKQNIAIRAMHTKEKIFFLVTYSDKTENIDHKSWHWTESEDIYVEGPEREDTFVFKWSLEKEDVDLSVYADNEYKADIWFWKAARTNPKGYADDKLHILSFGQEKKSTVMESKTGKKMFLTRLGDKGLSTYYSTFPVNYSSDVLQKYKYREPTLSRADVKAKGQWGHGLWVIEFSRDLKTFNDNDIQFDTSKNYYFGVSLYEIAGKLIGYNLEQPLYGCGDIYNKIKLKFNR